jgi:hypothetical protein
MKLTGEQLYLAHYQATMRKHAGPGYDDAVIPWENEGNQRFWNALAETVQQLWDSEPCSHPGCLNHVTHPCEGCGRIAGKARPTPLAVLERWLENWPDEEDLAFARGQLDRDDVREALAKLRCEDERQAEVAAKVAAQIDAKLPPEMLAECSHERTETRADVQVCLGCGERRMMVWGDVKKPHDADCRSEADGI